MWRPRKLCVLVENDGYPLPLPPPYPPPFRPDLDNCHMTGVPLKDLEGLDRPSVMSRPGLDQPPPGMGDGLRDKDMGVFGVPKTEESK